MTVRIPLLSGLLALFTPFLASAFSTIQLSGGMEVSGEILKEQTDRIFVDIGYTVLDIPRDSIVDISKEEEAEPQLQYSGDLFRTIRNARNLSIKELAEKHGQSVVLIQTPTGLGSGFVIHPDGFVITNDHVTAGEHKVSVTLFETTPQGLNRVQFENVRIVATSSDWDLALLKIETTGERTFPTLPLGDSDVLRQGQPVFAIGSPLGLERTVSEGIISVKNRLLGGSLFIQTTTQISPGNSGGPLLNTKGEVVGVNNMKVVAEGAEGLAFAIPVSVLKTFLKNRDAFAFDPRNPNAGFKYNSPPVKLSNENKEP